MTTAQAIFAILAAIVGITGALGIAYAVFTSARVKQTIELYEKENKAQGTRISSLEIEVEKLREQNEVLRDLATGKSAIDAFVTVFTRTMERVESKIDELRSAA